MAVSETNMTSFGHHQPSTWLTIELSTVLDQTHMRYSYKHHSKVSLTAVADSVNHSEWHLPTFDPRNENKYHYKLHSLDIYFWTQQDALQFVNGVRRVLPPAQVEVLDEPAPSPQPLSMSHVVQKLEIAAISDPQYGMLPGPPAMAPLSSSDKTQPASFVPMAYNPAAPAAPETIQHREKTPPPDDDLLNPLAVAVAYDYQKQPFTPGFPPQAQFPPGTPCVPPPQFACPPQFNGPPQHPGVQRAATMPVGMPSPGLSSPAGFGFPGAQSGSVPPQQQALTQSHTQPTPPIASPGLPPPPPGGFSSYSYSQQNQPRQAGQDYSVHQQIYRPTETEAVNAQYVNGVKPPEPKGKLEENAGRLERGVSGMLKKFEKKFG